MYLPMDRAEMVLRLLLEGNSVSTVERVTDVHHGTILKLLALAGEKSELIMGRRSAKSRYGMWNVMRYGASSAKNRSVSALKMTSFLVTATSGSELNATRN